MQRQGSKVVGARCPSERVSRAARRRRERTRPGRRRRRRSSGRPAIPYSRWVPGPSSISEPERFVEADRDAIARPGDGRDPPDAAAGDVVGERVVERAAERRPSGGSGRRRSCGRAAGRRVVRADEADEEARRAGPRRVSATHDVPLKSTGTTGAAASHGPVGRPTTRRRRPRSGRGRPRPAGGSGCLRLRRATRRAARRSSCRPPGHERAEHELERDQRRPVGLVEVVREAEVTALRRATTARSRGSRRSAQRGRRARRRPPEPATTDCARGAGPDEQPDEPAGEDRHDEEPGGEGEADRQDEVTRRPR